MTNPHNYVIRTGSTITIMSDSDLEVLRELPAKTYTVDFDKMRSSYLLNTVEDFELPSKIYGDTLQRAERVLNTFEHRPFNTGVHLDGDKGSGKTLLAKTISVLGKKRGYPTIIINSPFFGDDFNKFIQSISTHCVIIFDEFEKVYGYHDQQKILTLLDGVYPTKKLFVVTTNETHNVSPYMKNRPGRIYYSFKYSSLEQNFIREYCEDNLNDKSQIEKILKYTSVYSFFNFDMLSAAVEEMNRYGEPLNVVLQYINIVPESKSTDMFSVVFVIDGNECEIEGNLRDFDPNEFYYEVETRLLTVKNESGVFTSFAKINDCNEDEISDYSIHFGPEHLAEFDPVANRFTYRYSHNGVTTSLLVTKNATTYKPNLNSFLF